MQYAFKEKMICKIAHGLKTAGWILTTHEKIEWFYVTFHGLDYIICEYHIRNLAIFYDKFAIANLIYLFLQEERIKLIWLATIAKNVPELLLLLLRLRLWKRNSRKISICRSLNACNCRSNWSWQKLRYCSIAFNHNH